MTGKGKIKNEKRLSKQLLQLIQYGGPTQVLSH